MVPSAVFYTNPMPYQVLARKYRPKGFDTLVGQEHVVRALSHALDSGRLHHAYLFTGTRGVGKTTLSRILAKALNCQGLDGNGGVTSHPCGNCNACVAIDGGRFVDYIEIDAASNRGVDEMAQLLEQAVYAPSNARFKIYMIDEVHMLTNHAFNAMLKTLEEPPPHVKFVLATTDPQKIPVTVLSRCLQFNLKQMPPTQIIAHLSHILTQEKIAFEMPSLRLLAQGAHGSMRDALSLTDQAIAYAAGNVTLEAVQGMLGALDQSFLVRILDALAECNGAALMAIADDMATRSLSYSVALQDIGSLLHRVALAQTVPTALPSELPEYADILRLAELFDVDEIQLFYQIAVHGRNELGLAPDDFAGFSMTLLRMLAFRPGMGAADSGAPARPGQTGQPILKPAPDGLTSNVQTASVPVQAPDDEPGAVGDDLNRAGRRAGAALVSTAPLARGVAAPQPVTQDRRAARATSPARAALDAARSRVRAPATVRLALPKNSNGVVASHLGGSAVASPAIDLAPVPQWDDTDIRLAPMEGGDGFGIEDMSQSDLAMPAGIAAKAETMPNRHMRPIHALSDAPAADFATPALVISLAPDVPAASEPGRPAVSDGPAILTRVAALDWDGDWPALAAVLPVRGVVQQLAQQSEFINAEQQGAATVVRLTVAVETLRSTSTVEKLAAALTERFSMPVRIETVLGAVGHTATSVLAAERAERQLQAEQAMRSDPFVQTMLREFGATIVPGSVKPISTI
ncbi:MAG: DNA polymerase III subunit gamma/tau [Burkholderiaceae bacterium]